MFAVDGADADSAAQHKLAITVPANGEKLQGSPKFSGTAPADMSIELHIDGVPRGKAVADSEGLWKISLDGQGTDEFEEDTPFEPGSKHKARIVGRGPGRELKGMSDPIEFEVEK